MTQLIKKKTPAQMFFCDFCTVFKNTLFIEHLHMATSDASGFYLKTYPDIILKNQINW